MVHGEGQAERQNIPTAGLGESLDRSWRGYVEEAGQGNRTVCGPTIEMAGLRDRTIYGGIRVEGQHSLLRGQGRGTGQSLEGADWWDRAVSGGGRAGKQDSARRGLGGRAGWSMDGQG